MFALWDNRDVTHKPGIFLDSNNRVHGFEELNLFLQTFLHENLIFEWCAATFLKICEGCWFKPEGLLCQAEEHTH